MDVTPPRLGLGLRSVCAEALGEQLVDALRPRPGETAADVLGDSGVLAELVARTLGPDAVAACEPDSSGTLPLGDAACDVAGCLLTVGFGDVPRLLAEMTRVLRPGGRAAVIAYSHAAPPPHEQAVRDALPAASAYFDALIPNGLAEAARAAGWSVGTTRDVARFDGPAHLWSALVEQRPAVAAAASGDGDGRRDACFAALAEFAGADDTLRVPFEALLLTASR